MSRRQRQHDELCALCTSGVFVRALDLAFEHFADFGRDEEVVARLADAIERASAPAAVRRRFAALLASHD